MLPEIPKLEDYDVSPKNGFLPEDLPCTKLKDPYYAPWESLAENFPALILTRRLRGLVDKMPLLSTDRLDGEAEWRRAVVILGFIAHGYVWSGDQPSDHLPKQVSEPWVKVCDHFELPAIVTYAGVCLWNYKKIIPDEDLTLDNLATLHTFTGSIDESWFYLVSTAIEKQGAPCLTTGLEAIHACRRGDSETVVRCLQTLAESIDAINTSLGRMYDMCDPHTFYFRIRPYLAGWKNMTDAGLPKGVRYGDEKEYRQISGGSNAQSSLIQALDILLDVEHHPTGERPRKTPGTEGESPKPVSEKKRNNFIHEMRTYMPGPHRRFLESLQQVADIRNYVMSHKDETPALVISYDACLAMLRAFRDKHIQVVSRYIILQAREAQRKKQTNGAVTKREGLASTAHSTLLNGKKRMDRGTGGTALIPFLKQARDETGDPAASSWGKRLLGDNTVKHPPVVKRYRFSSSDEEDTVSKNKYANAPHNVPLPSAFRNYKEEEEENEHSVGLNGQWEVEPKEKNRAGHW
ncbi:indoleamine 2,3-dioxygenase [Trichomonascus vanleenenianus]|uniref:dioxygenase BNA2 n=1 Tax=Trichomonascus vanleenenianus TaxID=2268995 RepID=UPI003ECAB770